MSDNGFIFQLILVFIMFFCGGCVYTLVIGPLDFGSVAYGVVLTLVSEVIAYGCENKNK